MALPTPTHAPRLALLAALTCLSSCTGEGEVEVRVWGEDFIELGIPADELADGWAVEFTRFEVELSEVNVAGVSFDEPATFDLAEASEGRGQLVGRSTTDAGEFDDGRFVLAEVIVEGQANKDGVSKQFVWAFPTAVRYSSCDTTTNIEIGGVGEFQVTVHADHLFYDSLASEEPALRFEALAAADDDGDADGIVTQAELEAAGLGAYDPGNLDVANLWAFLVAQAQTMGHVDGEGHCEGST